MIFDVVLNHLIRIFPVLQAKYPLAHIPCPQYCLRNDLNSLCSLYDDLPFNFWISLLTDTWGGMDTHTWTCSFATTPDNISTPISELICLHNSRTRTLTSSFSTFFRYFVHHTKCMWSWKIEWLPLLYSFMLPRVRAHAESCQLKLGVLTLPRRDNKWTLTSSFSIQI